MGDGSCAGRAPRQERIAIAGKERTGRVQGGLIRYYEEARMRTLWKVAQGENPTSDPQDLLMKLVWK